MSNGNPELVLTPGQQSALNELKSQMTIYASRSGELSRLPKEDFEGVVSMSVDEFLSVFSGEKVADSTQTIVLQVLGEDGRELSIHTVPQNILQPVKELESVGSVVSETGEKKVDQTKERYSDRKDVDMETQKEEPVSLKIAKTIVANIRIKNFRGVDVRPRRLDEENNATVSL